MVKNSFAAEVTFNGHATLSVKSVSRNTHPILSITVEGSKSIGVMSITENFLGVPSTSPNLPR